MEKGAYVTRVLSLRPHERTFFCIAISVKGPGNNILVILFIIIIITITTCVCSTIRWVEQDWNQGFSKGRL